MGSNTKYKVSIENIGKSSDPLDTFGTFDLVVRDFYDNDEKYISSTKLIRGLNLRSYVYKLHW